MLINYYLQYKDCPEKFKRSYKLMNDEIFSFSTKKKDKITLEKQCFFNETKGSNPNNNISVKYLPCPQ
jgi:hypothetical protein